MATLFPIGTVVKLENNNLNTLIVGYGGANAEGVAFDYVGLPCPVGMVNKNATSVFNDSQIEQLVYMGYLDSPTQTYIAKIEEAGKDELPVFKKTPA